MKNIHVLPTAQPSRLSFVKDRSSDVKDKLVLFNTEGEGSMTHHIYITSDEEIKEDDWGLSKLNEVILFGRSYNEKFYKKIILTTDQDLIADGVQAINDEFLEWFVKNPSCESVETKVVDFEVDMGLGDECIEHSSYYKIIIPQEEPKYIEDEFEMQSRIINKVWDEEPKQETLEEAAERLIINPTLEDKQVFKEGAKWQAEQDKKKYSEEEIMDMFHSFNMHLPLHYEFLVKEQFKKK
jgi:hypothetical protein